MSYTMMQGLGLEWLPVPLHHFPHIHIKFLVNTDRRWLNALFFQLCLPVLLLRFSDWEAPRSEKCQGRIVLKYLRLWLNFRKAWSLNDEISEHTLVFLWHLRIECNSYAVKYILMRSIITIVFFVLTSTHKQILTKAHYYLNIFTVYLKTCGCGYFLEPHTRMLVTSLACRVFTKSRGWVFFLATMRVSLGYFHGKREEIDPKVLPSCPIPLLQ